MPINIVACVKQTPATANVQIDPKTGTLKREGVASAINPFDEYAIEESIRLKERLPGSWCATITMGPPQAQEALKESIARGCDDAYHICGREFAGADTYATSYTLYMGIKKIAELKGKVDLIICGKQTNDGDTGHVGPGLGAWFDWPSAAYVRKVEKVDDKKIRIHRLMEDGTDVIDLPLPAVITVVKEINRPRAATVKGKMNSKKAVIPMWNAQILGCEKDKIGLTGSPTIVSKSFAPPPRSGSTPIPGETTAQKAQNLLAKLREAGVLNHG
ncbi:MAG: electron transfer flavoprotein subunit beta/FixA family protein [Elusimicrobiota bacterium]